MVLAINKWKIATLTHELIVASRQFTLYKDSRLTCPRVHQELSCNLITNRVGYGDKIRCRYKDVFLPQALAGLVSFTAEWKDTLPNGNVGDTVPNLQTKPSISIAEKSRKQNEIKKN